MALKWSYICIVERLLTIIIPIWNRLSMGLMLKGLDMVCSCLRIRIWSQSL